MTKQVKTNGPARAPAKPTEDNLVPDLLDIQLCTLLWPVMRNEEDAGRKAATRTGTLLGTMQTGDGVERMILVQMIAAHNASLDSFSQAVATKSMDAAMAYRTCGNRSARTFAALVSALTEIRGKSSQQKVTVEHVHVHAGGQAIVGNVDRGVGGKGKKAKGQSHASDSEAMRGEDEGGSSVPLLGAPERPLPDAWRDKPRRAQRQPKRASPRVLDSGVRSAKASEDGA